MKDFITNISSLYWWISVVVVGILINLFSSYLKDRLDRYLSGVSSRWRQQSEKQKAKTQRILDKLRNEPSEQVFLLLSELRTRIKCLFMLVWGVLLYGFVTMISSVPSDDITWWPFSAAQVAWLIKLMRISSMALASLAIFMYALLAKDANRKERLIEEARKTKNVDENPKSPPNKSFHRTRR